MLTRLYLLLAGIWAITFLANGATKVHGIGSLDLGIALAPFAIGWLLSYGARFVVTGSFRRRPRGPVIYR